MCICRGKLALNHKCQWGGKYRGGRLVDELSDGCTTKITREEETVSFTKTFSHNK